MKHTIYMITFQKQRVSSEKNVTTSIIILLHELWNPVIKVLEGLDVHVHIYVHVLKRLGGWIQDLLSQWDNERFWIIIYFITL